MWVHLDPFSVVPVHLNDKPPRLASPAGIKTALSHDRNDPHLSHCAGNRLPQGCIVLCAQTYWTLFIPSVVMLR
jgi:hypothetical protein